MLCCHLDVESSTVHACPLLSIWIYGGYKFGGSCYCNSKFLETQELRPMIRTQRCTWACHCRPVFESHALNVHWERLHASGSLFACWQLLFPPLCRQPPDQVKHRATVGSGDHGRCSWSAWSWALWAQPHSCWWNGLCGSPTSQSGRLWPAWSRCHLPALRAGSQEQPEGPAALGEPLPGCVPALHPERGSAGQRHLQLPCGGVAAQPQWHVVQTRLRTPLARWLFGVTRLPGRVNLPGLLSLWWFPLCDRLCVA